MENKFKAVIFDLDGTIIDTEKYYRRFWPEAVSLMGEEMTDEMVLSIRSLGSPFAPARFKEWYGEDFDYLECKSKRKEIMEAYIDEHGIEKKPGVMKLLEELKKRGIVTAIATATDLTRANKYLEMVGLSDAFDKVISATMVKEGKPSPDVYLYACNELGFEPKVCIGVEDSPNGVLSAYRAGLNVVMVPDQTPLDTESEKYIFACVKTLDEIIDLLD